jgi:hypothetical protein
MIMPITKTPHLSGHLRDQLPSTHFEGRVLKVMTVVETRNWSDTLDWSDYRSTLCTYALVWLGEHGVPARAVQSRPCVNVEPSSWDTQAARELGFHEQFAWVDCTNVLSDRYGYTLSVTADAEVPALAQANLIAWEAFMAAEAAAARKAIEEAAAKAAAKEAASAAKAAARALKKGAALEATKAAADADMARLLPLKGKAVTLKSGVKGTLFWLAVKAYRGAYSCRIGVRDTAANVTWAAAADLA